VGLTAGAVLLAAMLAGAGSGDAPSPAVRPLEGLKTWAAYYGAAEEAGPTLARFDLVVLEPARHPPLQAVKRHGALVLMYVSLGEVNVHAPAYAAVASAPWVLDPNPNWPDARRLDVRDGDYARWLLDRVVPAALAPPGVNGLFLDTADTALDLERQNPGRFRGMTAALELTLRKLRAAHPRAVIALNGGLSLAERLPGLLDGVVVESVWTDYDFATRRYRLRAASEAAARAAELDRLRRLGLPVLTLEYMSSEAPAWVRELIARTRARGFVPYVATIGLDQVFTFTLD
jgi:uncharacterized protein (TIGR01370 family)